MKRFMRFRSTDPRLIGSHSVDEDVSKELEHHLEMRARELIEEGWDPDEARAEARRVFGDLEGVARECEDVTGSYGRRRHRVQWLDALRHDLRFAIRQFLADPGFAVIAILTLALGVGANAAIFTVVNAVLLRPLPIADPEDVVVLWEVDDRGRGYQVSPPNFADWHAQNRSFESMAYSAAWGAQTVLGATRPTRATVELVSRDFFRLFGVEPFHGRVIAPDENRPGGDRVAVVSHRFWQTSLGGDRDLTAHTLELIGNLYQVVGVMPPDFRFQFNTDIWLPAEQRDMGRSRTSHFLRVAARYRDGVDHAQASADMNDLATRVREQYPSSDAASVRIDALTERLVGQTRRPLLLLLGASGLLLLIACTNIASTLLARGAAREREIAVRLSLGAGRSRIVRQLLTESFVLAALGGGAGLLLALAAIRALVTAAPAAITRVGAITVDGGVIAFTGLASGLTAIVFGLLPAFRASAGEAAAALRGGGRGNTARGGIVWRALVGVEVALALMLLVGSGLLIRSFWTVLNVDAGFDPEGVLTVELSLPNSKYEDGEPVRAILDRLLTDLRAVPGVETAGLVNALPLSGHNMFAGIMGADREEVIRGEYRMASAEYFASLNIPVLQGRTFTDRDDAAAPHVILINRALARQRWPGEDPVGRRVRLTGNDRHSQTWLTIIGVVGDLRHFDLTTDDRPTYYVHYRQRSQQGRTVFLTLQTRGDAEKLIPVVQRRLRALDPDVPAEFSTMDSRVAGSVADRRFTMLVLGTFAGVALVLAVVGIYGVVSYTVARRTREIGIRIALGATPRKVQAMVVRHAMLTVAVGLAAGAVGTVLTGRAMASLLYEVRPADPLTLSGVLLVLVAAALAASAIPARRTARVDPMSTSRSE